MNTAELIKKLKKNNIPEWYYNVTGVGETDQKICLETENNKWKVYYTERGVVSRLRWFETESEACMEVLRQFDIE